MFSQNREEEYILMYFANRIGAFLDCGAFDGVTFSNTRALALRGWRGVCIEPSPTVFSVLEHNYASSPNVICLNEALSTYTGTATFYDNHQAVATLKKAEAEQWAREGQEFSAIEIKVSDFDTFYRRYPNKYDMISIDTEGMDYEILSQIDLDEVGCDVLCVEYNGTDQEPYSSYAEKFGLRLVYRSPENMIMVR